MKFIAGKSQLTKGFFHTQGIVAGAASKKNKLMILTNVLLEATGNKLNIYTTDLEISCVGTYPVNVLEEGRVVLPAKRIYSIIKELPEKEIKLEVKENNLTEIYCDKAYFKIPGLSTEDFPSIPSYQEKEIFTIKSNILKEMIEKIILTIPKDEAMKSLGGAFIKVDPANEKELLMIATDGNRLSYVKKDIGDKIKEEVIELKKGIIFPKKGVYELFKILDEKKDIDILVSLIENSIIFKADDLILSVRLLSGGFPDYQEIIPKETKYKIKINRKNFMNSLRRLSTLLNEGNKKIKLFLKDNTLKIISSDPEFGEGEDEIRIDFQEEEIEIGFNPHYLIDALNIIKDEEIMFEFNDKSGPVIIQPVLERDFFSVIMPMRLI